MATNETPKRAIAIETALLFAREGEPPIGLKVSAPTLGKSIEVRTSELHPDIAAWACMHGIKQKLVDAAAISRNAETGRSATVQDKWDALYAVFERVTAAEPSWNMIREGGGSGSLLFQALCRVYDTKAPEAIKEWLGKKTDAEKKALELNARVAEVIAAIRVERAKDAKDVDSDALLTELE